MKEEQRLNTFFSISHTLEHIGSTSVPGLGGKEIIDMYMIVDKSDMAKALADAQKAGYTQDPDFHIPNQYFLYTDLPDKEIHTRRYTLQIGPHESDECQRSLLFRDYLRVYSEEAQKYAEIKEQACEIANNSEIRYKQMKEPIMLEILYKAAQKKREIFAHA